MALVVSDFLDSLPKVSSNHCFSDSSNGRLRAFRTSRRSSAERPRISSSMAYRAAIRSSASFATADLRLIQIVERPTNMRHAGSLVDSSTFINLTVAGVSICLQRGGELPQMRLGMFALAIRRVGEPHGWWCLISPGTVVPHIGPQSSRFGFAFAWCQHRHRRVVRVQLRRTHHLTSQCLYQRLQ